MPPQLLLSPAGLPFEGGVAFTRPQPPSHSHLRPETSNNSMMAGATGSNSRTINNSRNSRYHSASSSSSSSFSSRPSGSASVSRPPIKRTASTASVNERIMDMLNPRKQEETHYVDSDDDDQVGRDEDEEMMGGEGVGMQEDWEIEQEEEEEDDDDNPFAAAKPSSRQGRMETEEEEETMRSSSPDMMLDSPTRRASPTPRRGGGHGRLLAPPTGTTPAASKRKTFVAEHQSHSDDDDNPFLSKSGTSSSRKAGPPSAPRKPAPKKTDRVSYVFRGKRITYDAPLEAMYPDSDDADDAELSRQLKAQSGPRVLFPSPPTPVASTSSLPPSSHQVSPPSNKQKRVNTSFLMQTPVRKPSTAASSSSSTSSSKQYSTPADRITAALQEAAAERAEAGIGLTKEGKGRKEPAAPFIPPTPASLPQKSKAERDSIERERLAGAMRGIQAAHSRAAAAVTQRGAEGASTSSSFTMAGDSATTARRNRYAPYPPR